MSIRVRTQTQFLVGLILNVVFIAPEVFAATLQFEVRETAGIRRFSYPVEWSFELPNVSAGSQMRLLLDGKPIVAQFRNDTQDNARRWRLDFNASLLPYEAKTFAIEYGPDVPEGPQPRRGFTFNDDGDSYRVTNAPYLEWNVAKDLSGLLQSMRTGKSERWNAQAAGLLIRDAAGAEFKISALDRTDSRVLRQGPLAVSLWFKQPEVSPQMPDIDSTVVLTFQSSKSWIRVDWTVTDPKNQVAELESRMGLKLEAPERSHPTLVDFGATTQVYTTLPTGIHAELRAGPPSKSEQPHKAIWQVNRGRPGGLEPFVFGPRTAQSGLVTEGWSHIMDRRNCLALAVAEFARSAQDRITASADGRFTVARVFTVDGSNFKPGQKHLRFWMHFVTNPPHISAATSPQSMQTPLVVGR